MSKIAAKYSESHDRLTVNIKFPDGGNIRLTESRGGSRVSGKGIPEPLFNDFVKRIAQIKGDDAPVERCKRVMAAVEGHSTIEEVLAAYGQPKAAVTPTPAVAPPSPAVAPPSPAVAAEKTGLPSPTSNNEEIAKAIVKKAKADGERLKIPATASSAARILDAYVATHKLSSRREDGIQAKILALGVTW